MKYFWKGHKKKLWENKIGNQMLAWIKIVSKDNISDKNDDKKLFILWKSSNNWIE